MKVRRLISKFVVPLGTLALAWIAVLPEAAAQGCAMCYQNAAASGPQGRFALQRGILILFFPALGFFGSILFLLYRRRDSAGRVSSLTQSSSETAVHES
jgi:hypothetical protein